MPEGRLPGPEAVIPFHYAVVVPDLDDAVARFERLFGLAFASPVDFEVTIRDSRSTGGWRSETTRTTYSRQGPPHVELTEGTASGMLAERGSIHHVGFWTPDVSSTRTEFEALGYETEAEMVDQSARLIVWYLAPGSLFGVRAEFVDEVQRPAVEAWISTGRASALESAPVGTRRRDV